MPDEPPKYTIADHYDPDGEIQPNADLAQEYFTYSRRVRKGGIADMGLTLEDFKRHIDGLSEKLFSKSQVMGPFINANRDALAQKNWYAALTLALTMPDICAQLEKPGEKGIGQRYADWWNTYVSPKYDGSLSGDVCYALRCAFLHNGFSYITKKRKAVSDFVFVYPDPKGQFSPHCNQFVTDFHGQPHNVLQLQVDLFCIDVCSGVERWEQEKLSKDPEIQKRADNMLVIFPPENFLSASFSRGWRPPIG